MLRVFIDAEALIMFGLNFILYRTHYNFKAIVQKKINNFEWILNPIPCFKKLKYIEFITLLEERKPDKKKLNVQFKSLHKIF